VFALSNSSDVLLLLRVRELGAPAKTLPLFWCIMHISKALLSTPLGTLGDRIPKAKLLAISYLLYAVHYLGFAATESLFLFGALMLSYGAVHALQEPAEKALVRELSKDHERGRAFGAYYIATGLLAFPATLGTSTLWERSGAPVALGTCAAIALIACALMTARARQKA
jgi:MFS family permease